MQHGLCSESSDQQFCNTLISTIRNWWLGALLLLWRPGFIPRPVVLWLAADKLELEQAVRWKQRCLPVSIIPLHTHSSLYHRRCAILATDRAVQLNITFKSGPFTLPQCGVPPHVNCLLVSVPRICSYSTLFTEIFSSVSKLRRLNTVENPSGLISPMVTICSAQWSLYVPSGLTIINSTFCPHSVFVCLCGSENKQQLFPYTALTDWFL
jgi:hypothetical protein